MATAEQAEGPVMKKARVWQACRSCRSLKRKCSGGRPCSHCQKMDFACVFEAAAHLQAKGGVARDMLGRGASATTQLFDQLFCAEEQRGRVVRGGRKSSDVSGRLLVLPARSDLETYLRQFETETAVHARMVHPVRLLQAYDKAQDDISNGHEPDLVTVALITSLSAVAEHYRKGRLAQRYYERARQLLHACAERSEPASQSLVQTYLYQTLYEVSTAAIGKSVWSTSSLRLAAQIAIDLDLHEEKVAACKELIEQEEQRRTWFLCRNCAYSASRRSAVFEGKAGDVHHCALAGRRPVTGLVRATLNRPRGFPDEQPPMASIHTSNLLSSLADILEMLYSGEAKAAVPSSACALEQTLDAQWDCIMATPLAPDTLCILGLRIQLARLLLHRPSLQLLLEAGFDEHLTHYHALREGAGRCVKAAWQMLSIAAQCTDNSLFNSCPVYNTDYIFAALTVLSAGYRTGVLFFTQPPLDTWSGALSHLRVAMPSEVRLLEASIVAAEQASSEWTALLKWT